MSTTWLQQHSKTIAFLSSLGVFLIFYLVFGTDVAYAQTAPDSELNLRKGSFEATIYGLAVMVGGMFLWVGGTLLDYTITYLVIGMGLYMEANLGVVIDMLWVVVRDLFNIVFIFGLIWIGFRTILFSNDTNTKKALGYLIVAALMINFSLFITKAIIDFSNIAAFQIHTALLSSTSADTANVVLGGTGESITLGDKIDQKSVTAAFMNATKITTFADGSMVNQIQNETSSFSGRIIGFGILMMFFMMFAGFVFAAGAIILIGRFIALVIFMILSPMMFLGLIFPKLGGMATDWWKRFLKYAFVAPAYLFMLYLSLFALSGIGVNGSFATAYHSEAASNGSFFIVLYFFLVTGFLVASLKVANMMGVYGSEGAWSLTQSTGKWFARQGNYAARYPDRWARRKVVGGTAKRFQKAFDRYQAKNPSGRIQRALRYTRADQLSKEYTDGMQNWAPSGLKLSYKADKEFDENQRKAINSGHEAIKRGEAIAEEIDLRTKPGLTDTTVVRTDKDDEDVTVSEIRGNALKATKKLTVEQMGDMKLEGLKPLARDLSDQQIKDLAASGKYSVADIEELKKERKKTNA